MTLPSSQTYARWLGIVRILTGAMWLLHALPKFLNPGDFLPPNGAMTQYLQQGLATTSGPYRDFVASFVVPNAGLFAELVRLGELGVGISLFLGLFSRLGGFFGIILPLNYMAARGALGTLHQWGSLDASLMLLSAISLVLPTGRAFGVDAFATRRTSRPRKVVPEVVPERPLDGPTAPS